ncbi:helix-turn-helix domain-containing protein [Chloroflexota bacterium]
MDLNEFYDSIDLNKINEFTESQREEDLHLDFKRLNDSKMDRDDRKNFAKALSGFANSDGGIIVWGIDARPNSKGINCASDKFPIRQLRLTISRLNEFTSSLVNPSVDGVIHKPIECGDDSGFAVALIPSSDSTPHMAKGGEDRYFKRSGDSFIRMEHFDIEDMFGRRPKPNLFLYYRVIRGPGRNGDALDFGIVLGLKNDGKSSARAPYLSIHSPGYVLILSKLSQAVSSCLQAIL